MLFKIGVRFGGKGLMMSQKTDKAILAIVR
jgi:hypothetical protein